MSTQTTRSGGGTGRTKKAAAGGADTNHSAKKQQQHQAAESTPAAQKQNHTDSHKDKENVPAAATKPHLKATPEQTRMAQLIGNGLSSTDDGKMQEKVASLMETTQRSEEDVCFALYECDNDLDRAVIYLLEQLPEGAFEKSGKKKKNRLQAGATNNGNGAANDDDWNDNAMPVRRGDDRSRTRGGLRNNAGGGGAGGRPGDGQRPGDRFRKDGDNKFGGGGGGRGLDNRGGDRDRDRRGDRGGDGIGRGGRGGGFGGRGGRGGRMGPRGLGSRDQQGGGMGGRGGYGRSGYDNGGGGGGPVEAMDNWDNSQANLPPASGQEKTDDSWGDWDNEEYTGSLADTKVFTPSTAGGTSEVTTASIVAGGGDAESGGAAVTTTSSSTAAKAPNYSQVLSSAVAGGASVAAVVSGQQPGAGAGGAAAAATGSQYSDLASNALRQNLVADMPSAAGAATGASAGGGGAAGPTTTLSAEQSQYFNSLTSQNSSQQAAQANAYQAAGVQYPSSYGSAAAGYGDGTGAQAPQQQRKPLPRAKVPPPSKIPASAVEMPGDMGGYLDVQFGLDFGSEETFDQLSDRFGAATIEAAAAAGNAVAGQQAVVDQQDAYQQQAQQVKAGGQSGATGLSDQLVGGYGAAAGQRSGVVNQGSVQANNTGAPAGYQSQYGAQSGGVQAVAGGQGAGQVAGGNKNVRSPYAVQGVAPSVANNSYVSNATGGYQNQGQYSQQTQQQQQAYGGYNQTTGGYNQSNVAVNSNQVSSQVQAVVNNAAAAAAAQTAGQVVNSRYGTSSSGGGGSGTGTSVTGSGAGGMSVSNSGSGTNGVGTGVSGGGGGGGNTSVSSSVAAQFGNSFGGASTASKLAAVVAAQQNNSNNNQTPISSTAFDSVASNVAASNAGGAGQGTASAISNNAAVAANNNTNMNSPSSLGLANNNTSKVSNATTKSNVVSNIPIVNQYIQASVPFYQPPVYSYEDLQMIQTRLPHVQTGYYDMNYQTQSSLGAAGVRDGAYSTMASDGRFARTDNNSSPVSNVPSTMSQQQAQAGSGGPMVNFPYAAYFYGGNMMPGFQYGTPVYPQQMATTNATSGGQFPKPNAYNSGYGSSAYDSLNQSAQDYGKSSGYQSAGVGQQQSKGQSVNNPQQSGSGSDISSSIYGKSHVALNKVNSYDKQSFHSGTPPPFNMAGNQTTGQTSQPYGMYISTMPAPHHSMNMHQPMHQDSSSSGGQRQQSNSQGKAGTKQGYSPSYWATQN